MFRFPDPTPVLSQLQSFPIKKRPVLSGTVFPAVIGKETSILTQAFPLWEFELTYDVLRTQTENIPPYYQQYLGRNDYEKILAVFLTCHGQYGRFFYRDRSDCSRFEQILGSGNGTNTRFRLIRTVGTGSLAFQEPVGGIDLSVNPTVKINYVPQVANWLIEDDLQTLAFNDPPDPGLLVTIDYYFFYYCRFLSDVNDFEEFMYNLHRSEGVKFRSTKDTDEGTPNPYFFPET